MRTKAVNIIKKGRNHPVGEEILRILVIVFGALVTAVGLEAFLIPNGFLDGGLTGIAIILGKFIPIPMGVVLAILNIPFIIIVWVNKDHWAAIRTAIGVAVLSAGTIVLHHIDPWTDEFFLALFFGGSLIGLGIGVALRAGGALDGTEAFADILNEKTRFTTGQILLFMNLVIFGTAALVIGPKEALASLALFFVVVVPMVNRLHGNPLESRYRVNTSQPEQIAAAITEHGYSLGRIQLDNSLVYKNGNFNEPSNDLYFNVARLHKQSVMDLIFELDPEASVESSSVEANRGGKVGH